MAQCRIRRGGGLSPFRATGFDTVEAARTHDLCAVRGGAYYERPCIGNAGSPPGSYFPTPSARAHADVLDPILRALAGVADPRRIVESVAPRHTFDDVILPPATRRSLDQALA